MGVYECFVHRQLRTTMDVACPEYLDFVHGGLQMQITHHVRSARSAFPSVHRSVDPSASMEDPSTSTAVSYATEQLD